ncbi:single-stranded DNA-binding protein [Parasediminibacterium paludis]|uniref:Single-stranded DNA-binding protein n=1 Tax=Parasediminibacterium paludis TaxID=908966 RepID=A0ABV8PXW3_9BACT
MIKLNVIGHLGKDAVVNNANGKSVINFSIAHTEKLRDAQGNQKDKTIWVDCAYWTDRVAIAPYLKKGTQVYAEGSPDIRTYTTNDGRNGATLTLRVLNIQLLGGRAEGDTSGGNYNNNYQQAAPQQSYQQAPPQQVYQPQPQQNFNRPAAPSAAELTEPLDDLPF